MKPPTKPSLIRQLHRRNLQSSLAKWGPHLSSPLKHSLKSYAEELQLSIERGELILIEGRWYVTHTGLLRLARRNRCVGMHSRPILKFCDPACSRWVFEATVHKSRTCSGFTGHGDANPGNVSPLVRGAEMRVAETRAIDRALRAAYGIGICSVEELGSFPGPLPPAVGQKVATAKYERPNGNGHHPLRDRLCLLIRQNQLDPVRVKAYAADYCDVAELRQASREQVATFIKHLAEYVQSDREGLLCQLNSYAPKPPTEALVTIANDSTATEVEKAAGAA